MKAQVNGGPDIEVHESNRDILEAKIKDFNSLPGARVGDYVKLPDGRFDRFTYGHGDIIQAGGTTDHFGYYLGWGYCSYSGSLNHGIKKSDLILTEETKQGKIWFFKDDQSGAHRGIWFDIDCRVFTLKEGADVSGCWDMKY